MLAGTKELLYLVVRHLADLHLLLDGSSLYLQCSGWSLSLIITLRLCSTLFLYSSSNDLVSRTPSLEQVLMILLKSVCDSAVLLPSQQAIENDTTEDIMEE